MSRFLGELYWPSTIMYGPFDKCVRNKVLKEYTIIIRSSYAYEEQRKAALAHELYHRATLLKGGLRRELWVDEMLAFLVSQQILRCEGLVDYAEHYAALLQERKLALDVDLLRKARSRREWFPELGRIVYPPGVGPGVARLGTALGHMVDWHTICRLISCREWNDWFAHVPAEIRPQVMTLLGMGLPGAEHP